MATEYQDLNLTARVTQVTVDVDLLANGVVIGSAIMSGESIGELLQQVPPIEEPEPDTDEGNNL